MGVVRRRYYIWLLRAYFKRWRKTIVSSILIGSLFFFLGASLLNFYVLPLLQKKVQKIGYVGTYTVDNIPDEILSDVSYGLTRQNENGTISPGAAYKWSVSDGGKSYTFYIKKGQYYNNKKELTADNLNIQFKDVKVEKIDDYAVKFVLEEPYSPFLTSVSKPIIGEKFAGLGDYKVTKVDVNAGFVKSIRLQNKKNGEYKKIIYFYPTQEALKVAYALGEIDIAKGVLDPQVEDEEMSSWVNTKVNKQVDYGSLVTIFYNTADPVLSDKKLREALSYSLPADFDGGKRAYSPISPTSMYFSEGPNYGISDISIAKSLIEPDSSAKKTVFEVSTSQEYEDLAKQVVSAWEKIGIKAKVNVVNRFPDKFQVLIYPINLPDDPDQYTLWHSGQPNNITNYKNLRIDKLLEDGRSTTDVEDRKSIYADFQKYLIDDSPATFIYFPYIYEVVRD